MRHLRFGLLVACVVSPWVVACFAPPTDNAPPDAGIPDGATSDANPIVSPDASDASPDTAEAAAVDASDAAPDAPAASINKWTWVSGSTTTQVAGTYGTLGTAAPANTPGARYGATSWSDAAGNLWLYGGTPTTGGSVLNDVWKFDGTSWAWMAGSNVTNAIGVYGTKGTGALTNIPGARYFTLFTKDKLGSFWLYGGRGYGDTASFGMLSDLWKFDGTQWTWMSGSTSVGVAASYGTKGMAAAGNTPGGRNRGLSWIDNAGNAWVFGGRNAAGQNLNDLWKFDGANWTWVSGSNTSNAAGSYGTKGMAAAGNSPGAREDSVSWVDAAGNLWLFGGWGYDSAALLSDLGDLWKFDGANWTWVSGSSTGNGAASYGTLGMTAASNDPGGRENAALVTTPNGTVWLVSGTSSHDSGELNDVWKFDGANWTWVSGANTANGLGMYGPKGTAGTSYVPGGRDSASAWADASGNLWLFGGWAYGALGSANDINDLWRYQP